MGIEIERRFLVPEPRAVPDERVASPFDIIQGYFGYVDGLRVRVRILADGRNQHRAILSFKGNRRGLCRLEYEYPLPLEHALLALNRLPAHQIIRKKRYFVPTSDNLVWSVDEFSGRNKGLVIAEIELVHPDQEITLPPWAGREVTFDPRYGNSRLAIHGFPHGPSSARDPFADLLNGLSTPKCQAAMLEWAEPSSLLPQSRQ